MRASILGLASLALLFATACTKGEDVGEDCADGADNDGDGYADCDDAECGADPACQGTDTGPDEPDDEDCDNGRDDDGDDDVDCDDIDCASSADCDEPADEDCDNGKDDDDDGRVDCDDSQCASDPDCEEPTAEDCDNGKDDDGDGRVDCADSQCASDPDCMSTDPETVCDDTVDNDGDGDVDCADADCAAEETCRVLAWVEVGAATVVPGVRYTGVSQLQYIQAYTGAELCTYEWDVSSVANKTGCTGCDFAFTLRFDNGVGVSGDCPTYGLNDGISGNQYSYGYDANYNYGGTPTPTFMYYHSTYSAWYAFNSNAAASFDGVNFEYQWVVGYYYY